MSAEFCPQCGQYEHGNNPCDAPPEGDVFCVYCGAPLALDGVCEVCDEEDEA